MRILFKEYESVNYESYQFPYCIYGIKETGETYNDFYSRGFLPYSNELYNEEEIYYLARSIRIDLNKHSFNYKQNNVFNKLSSYLNDKDIEFSVLNKSDLSGDQDFIEWCLRYAKGGFLNRERLDYILKRPYLQDIIIINHKNDVLAYLFIITERVDFVHVWFSFYKTDIELNDFGKWIFLKTIEWAKNKGYSYLYAGTCYSSSAFYKLTLSPNTEYFDGSEWSTDISTLKRRLISDKK